MQIAPVLVCGMAAALAAASLPAQSRVVDLTGRPNAALDEPFTAITGLQEVAPGKVVIADMAEQRLVLGDLAANSVRDVGHKGGGPGEWQMAMGVSPGPGGVAYVADPSLRKLHAVDASGKIIRTVPFPGADGDGPGVMTLMIPRGTDNQGRMFFTGRPFVMGQKEQPDSVPILRWDARTKRTDTLIQLKNETKVTQSGGGASGSMRVMARVGGGPLRADPSWRPMPDGRVAVLNPSPYRVDVVDAASAIHRGTPVPFAPIKVGAAEREAYRKQMASQPRMGITVGSGGTSMRNMSGGDVPTIADEEFPATMGPYVDGGNLQVAPNGEIWVLRARPASDKVPTYDIFSNRGRLVGKATLRPNSQVVGFGAGVVYVARQDPSDDLRYIEQYPLQ